MRTCGAWGSAEPGPYAGKEVFLSSGMGDVFLEKGDKAAKGSLVDFACIGMTQLQVSGLPSEFAHFSCKAHLELTKVACIRDPG